MTLSDNIDDFCFMDFETRALPGVTGTDESVVTAGTYRYARNSYPVLLTWAIGDMPVECVELRDFSKRLNFDSLPLRLQDFAINAGLFEDRWLAAWNMGFDRAVWNRAFCSCPMPVGATIDVMAQAVASNLPPDLQGASKFIGRGGKQDDGKALINLFARANGGTPQSHPEEWARYKSYAIRDTEELREVFRATRKLPRREWEEYWTSERINERGMKVDVEFCRRAAAIAEADKARTNRLLRQLTGGAIEKISQVAKLADWLWDRLDSPEARNLMIKEWDEEEGEEIVGKIGLDRSRVEALQAFYRAREEALDGLTDDEWRILDILDLRQFGGSATPMKFSKILQQHDEGRLKGQYVFNGAQQTGRFSSRGVQVHNLTRSSLGKDEESAIEMINDLEL
jgi:DNA polymerase